MARQPRFFVKGQPLHVIQRGNNRAEIFRDASDCRFFLQCLCDAIHRHDVRIHAYVLMTNHLHLLATPGKPQSLPGTMQAVGRRYVQHYNTRHQRTGTLWEGRYRATLIDSEQYLLTCMRYIELNPVRAGLVGHPGEHCWSSYSANAEARIDLLVTPHDVYQRLSPSPEGRTEAYLALFQTALPDGEIDAVRYATNRNWVLGDETFTRRIESLTGRRGRPAPTGRHSNRSAGNASLTPIRGGGIRV
jgi:putative transposase